jgi:hypothetical protein
VYTVATDGATAKAHRVAVAFLEGRSAALRGGEADGLGQVITDGAAYLTDGAPVRLPAGGARAGVGMAAAESRRAP